MSGGHGMVANKLSFAIASATRLEWSWSYFVTLQEKLYFFFSGSKPKHVMHIVATLTSIWPPMSTLNRSTLYSRVHWNRWSRCLLIRLHPSHRWLLPRIAIALLRRSSIRQQGLHLPTDVHEDVSWRRSLRRFTHPTSHASWNKIRNRCVSWAISSLHAPWLRRSKSKCDIQLMMHRWWRDDGLHKNHRKFVSLLLSILVVYRRRSSIQINTLRFDWLGESTR